MREKQINLLFSLFVIPHCIFQNIKQKQILITNRKCTKIRHIMIYHPPISWHSGCMSSKREEPTERLPHQAPHRIQFHQRLYTKFNKAVPGNDVCVSVCMCACAYACCLQSLLLVIQENQSESIQVVLLWKTSLPIPPGRLL